MAEGNIRPDDTNVAAGIHGHLRRNRGTCVGRDPCRGRERDASIDGAAEDDSKIKRVVLPGDEQIATGIRDDLKGGRISSVIGDVYWCRKGQASVGRMAEHDV